MDNSTKQVEVVDPVVYEWRQAYETQKVLMTVACLLFIPALVLVYVDPLSKLGRPEDFLFAFLLYGYFAIGLFGGGIVTIYTLSSNVILGVKYLIKSPFGERYRSEVAFMTAISTVLLAALLFCINIARQG